METTSAIDSRSLSFSGPPRTSIPMRPASSAAADDGSHPDDRQAKWLAQPGELTAARSKTDQPERAAEELVAKGAVKDSGPKIRWLLVKPLIVHSMSIRACSARPGRRTARACWPPGCRSPGKGRGRVGHTRHEHSPELDPGLVGCGDHARLEGGPHVHNGNGTLDLTGKWPVGRPRFDVEVVPERGAEVFEPRGHVPGFGHVKDLHGISPSSFRGQAGECGLSRQQLAVLILIKVTLLSR